MILNMTGGVGLTKSQIIVTAPTGSAVTCTKGDVVKTAPEKDGTWTFKGLDLGTWTVAATLDGESTDKDVTLERLSIEYVTLEYTAYLANGAFLTNDLTGGWEGLPKKGYASFERGTAAPVVTQYDGYVTLTSNDGDDHGMYITKNKIDLTEYTTIVFTGFLYCDTKNEQRCCLIVWKDMPTTSWQNNVAVSVSESGHSTLGTYRVDISSLSGSYYIGFGLAHTNPKVRVDSMHLE